MPRIIVTATGSQPHEGSMLLDELVQSVHLSSGHAAAQLVERLAWAISDAEEAERANVERSQPPLPRAPRRRAGRAGHERRVIAA